MQRTLHSRALGQLQLHLQQRSRRVATSGGRLRRFGSLGLGPRAVDRRTYLAHMHAASGSLVLPCPLLLNRWIGGYQLDRQIGEGGSSVVYAASGLEDGRRVAIKVPKGDAIAASLRIKSDFRAARRLRHRHVVKMHHLLPVGDRYAAVMEWLGGPSLQEYVRGGTPAGQLPPVCRLLSVISQLSGSLAHMHAAGWVHGDVKPDNVHLTERGMVRWLDFDLATPVNRPLWMPQPVHVAGTFAYLSPEAIAGEAIGSSADMFSFGRLIAKLVCGRLPSWDLGLGTAASAARIRQQLPRETPKTLVQLCTELVRAAPADRPSAAEVYRLTCGESLPPGEHWRRPAPPQHVQAAAEQAMHRADQGRGTMLVVETAQPEEFDLDGLIAATRAEEARLTLCGHCDGREQTRLPGFDAMLDQLARWIEQVPPNLRTPWRNAVGDSLAAVSPPLAAGLGLSPQTQSGQPWTAHRSRLSDEACRDLTCLISAIAEQRTVVLAMHNLQDLDEAGQWLLASLLHRMSTRPIVIVATALRRTGQSRRTPVWSQATYHPLRMTVRATC